MSPLRATQKGNLARPHPLSFTVAWGTYNVLPLSSRRLEFPSDEQKEDPTAMISVSALTTGQNCMVSPWPRTTHRSISSMHAALWTGNSPRTHLVSPPSPPPPPLSQPVSCAIQLEQPLRSMWTARSRSNKRRCWLSAANTLLLLSDPGSLTYLLLEMMVYLHLQSGVGRRTYTQNSNQHGLFKTRRKELQTNSHHFETDLQASWSNQKQANELTSVRTNDYTN